MVRRTLRSSLWLLVVTLAVLARPLHAQDLNTGTAAGGSVSPDAVAVKTYTGFFNNTAVLFTAFETNDANFAAVNGLVFAPKLSNANPAVLPNMIFFQNGSAGQAVVLQTEPGFSNYSPIWRVIAAAWRGKGAMPLIGSYGAAIQLWQQGLLALQATNIVFNGPVVVINDGKGGARLAPTLSPNEFIALDRANRRIFLRGHRGYYAGQFVTFLALEHALGEIQNAPGAIPVPTIGVNFLGRGAIANFYEIPGQLPVLDSAPFAASPSTPVTTPTTTGLATIQGKTGPVGGQTGQTPVGGQTGQVGGQTGQVGGQTGQVGGQTGQVGGQTGQVGGQTGQVGGQTGQVGGQTGQVGGQVGQIPQKPVSPVTGQKPVSPVTGQKPVGGVSAPVNPNYSGLWLVFRVVATSKGKGLPLLTSVQDIANAVNAGLVVVQPANVQDVFNCPTSPVFVTGGTTGGTQTPTAPTGATPVTPTSPGPVTTTPTTPVGGTGGTVGPY